MYGVVSSKLVIMPRKIRRKLLGNKSLVLRTRRGKYRLVEIIKRLFQYSTIREIVNKRKWGNKMIPRGDVYIIYALTYDERNEMFSLNRIFPIFPRSCSHKLIVLIIKKSSCNVKLF